MIRYVALLLVIVLIGLQVKLWTGQGGMRDVSTLRDRVEQQKADNEKLKARNEALAADVHDLKNGDEAVEERARSELGLVKPGEIFYQVVDLPKGGASAPGK
ncbi:MAG: cell division protein FtsB [Dokdonella sp.]